MVPGDLGSGDFDLEEEGEGAAGGVEAIVGLLEHHRLGTVDDVGGHLDPSICGQTVHEHRRRIGERHHVGVDGVALELLHPLLLLGLLAHRHPGVGVDGMGSGDRLRRPMRLFDRCGTEQRESLEFGQRGRKADRTRKSDVHAQQRRHLGQRPGDVVEVSDIRHGLSSEIAEALLHRQRIGERLQRVRVIGQHVDHRNIDDRRHSGDGGMIEHPRSDERVVSLHHLRDVLDRLASVEADLLTSRVDRMTSQLRHRHLHRVTGAVGRLLEDQCGPTTGKRPTQRFDRCLGERQDLANLAGSEVGDVEQVPSHDSGPVGSIADSSEAAIIATASSTSSSVTVIGGTSRNVVGVTALTINPSPSRSL